MDKYELNIDTQITRNMNLDNILSCFLQKIADICGAETIFDIFESTFCNYPTNSHKSTHKNIPELFSIIKYILENAQLNTTKYKKRNITFYINQPNGKMSLCTKLVDEKYLHYAKQIIQYHNKYPRVNDDAKEYIQSLFVDNTPTTQDDGDNELFKYEIQGVPKVTLLNITTRYYKKGVFRNKNLYTNDYFKKYIMYIIDKLIKNKLIKSPNEMTSFNCYLIKCPDAYEGIWNNLSVCDVIKKMNWLHQKGEKSKKQVSENNEYLNSNFSDNYNIEAVNLAKTFTSDNNITQNVEQIQDEPTEIIFESTRGEDFLSKKNIDILSNYEYSIETIEYVNSIIGDKTGWSGDMRLSRLVRPRTWTFRRLAPRMGLREGVREGGRRAKARTRRLKLRTRRRKR